MTREQSYFRDNLRNADPQLLAEEAATWFLRMREPQVADQERQQFQHWLSASEQHQREYASFEKLWGVLDGISRPCSRKKRVTGSVVGFVAAIALAFVCSISTVDQQQMTKIGETRQLVLSDGSVIELDAATALRVEYTLWQRRITLERGQALFRVAPGLRPFEVKAGKGTLRDIGTTFNVLEDQGQVTVSVIEGAVEVSLDSLSKKSLLTGGQQAGYHAGGISAAKAINPEAIEAWLGNRWIFENASLGEVVRQINRQHEHQISLADSSLGNYRVSGVFDRTDRVGLLKALGVILPIRVEETPDGTRLRQR